MRKKIIDKLIYIFLITKWKGKRSRRWPSIDKPYLRARAVLR